jgi:hypothetical protein
MSKSTSEPGCSRGNAAWADARQHMSGCARWVSITRKSGSMAAWLPSKRTLGRSVTSTCHSTFDIPMARATGGMLVGILFPVGASSAGSRLTARMDRDGTGAPRGCQGTPVDCAQGIAPKLHKICRLLIGGPSSSGLRIRPNRTELAGYLMEDRRAVAFVFGEWDRIKWWPRHAPTWKCFSSVTTVVGWL